MLDPRRGLGDGSPGNLGLPIPASGHLLHQRSCRESLLMGHEASAYSPTCGKTQKSHLSDAALIHPSRKPYIPVYCLAQKEGALQKWARAWLQEGESNPTA